MPISGLSPDTYLLTVSTIFDGISVANSGPVAPKSPSLMVDTETSISVRFSISGSSWVSGRTSTSGIAAELRPPCTCDIGTVEVVVSKRLTSPEWVITGVGPDSLVASAKADLLGRVLRPANLLERFQTNKMSKTASKLKQKQLKYHNTVTN